ncbi:MAG: hypothetical protein KM310_06465 [Clostridiales bacterium]|nr:hypothetical protein [Clostridiales bacterium]
MQQRKAVATVDQTQEKELPGQSVTMHGLEVFTSFVDDHGVPVKVKEAQTAAPRIWILTHNAHLTVEQAKWVRDALDRWIRKVEGHHRT